MTKSPIEARVRKSGNSSTSVIIRAGGVVVQTEFAELVLCEFPNGQNPGIPVEIPPTGVKDCVVGPFSGSGTEAPPAEYANVIRLPAYSAQDLASSQAFEELRKASSAGSTSNDVLAKVPIMAIATGISGVVDESKQVRTHSVLPVWNDGSSVLVTMDWFEGEPGEGSPNPEWHMKASTGLPLSLGMQRLEEASRIVTTAKNCTYYLRISPWIFGAKLLDDKGAELSHKAWQREWHFDHIEKFSNALRRLSEGILGLEPPALPAAA